ncbi:MAG TPA: hypothetical protein VKQ72_06540 [Aggregatilineales bacterium]|nr:hypothetical protein [Aggregatilineales bacterium]
MGIDYVIGLDCVPKQTLAPQIILERLKARDRAAAIVKLYRDHGDQRSPSEMGFEMVRRTPTGGEETQVVIVQDLLDESSSLDLLSHHCAGCPANCLQQPFGCYGSLNYPISRAAELWLLKQLPGEDEPLPFLLLNQTMKEFGLTGAGVQSVKMRERPGVFFETAERFGRNLEDKQITTDHVFEMLFMVGDIQPPYAVMLLLFFGAIPRDMDAASMMSLTERDADRSLPFALEDDPDDDESIRGFKGFFEALHRAYRLGVALSLDV